MAHIVYCAYQVLCFPIKQILGARLLDQGEERNSMGIDKK